MVHDPYVVNYPGVEISDNLEEVVKGADAVIVLSGHSAYFDVEAQWLKLICGNMDMHLIFGNQDYKDD